MANFPVITQEQLEDRILREGEPWMGGANQIFRWTGVTVGAGQNFGSGNTNPTIKAFYAKTFTVSSSEDAYMSVFGPYLRNVSPNGSAAIGSTFIQSAPFTVPKGGTVVIPLNMLFDVHHGAPVANLLQVFEQDPKMSVPSITSDRVLTYNKNGGPLNQNTAVAGDKYSCLFNIINSSGVATSGNVVVTDIIPSQCRYISSSGTGWTITVTNGVLTATTPDVIANGGTKSFVVVYENTKLIRVSNGLFGYSVDMDIQSIHPPVWWNGTSITAGSTPTSYETHFTYLFKDWLGDTKNIPTRVFNRGIGGASSVAQELLRRTNNRYETLEEPKMAFWEQGINDSAQAVSNATSIANMKAYVKHVRRRSKDCPIFILAPFPTGNAPYEALNALLHTAMIPAVVEVKATDPNVHYVTNTRTLWNPVTEDTANTTDNIHPNDAGNLKIVNGIISFIIANNINLTP